MTLPNVLIIDIGLGNIGSVVASLMRLECVVYRKSEPPSLLDTTVFTHAVLPGVGAFSAGMAALKSSGWETWIKEVWCPLNRPLLGICLGMQLLASEGAEGGEEGDFVTGLNLIPGRVLMLEINSHQVLPHVGWNALYWNFSSSDLAHNIPNGGDMYFVHSYAFHPAKSDHGIAVSEYGEQFTAVVANGCCYGVQFHPEKSQKLGRFLLKNFLAL